MRYSKAAHLRWGHVVGEGECGCGGGAGGGEGGDGGPQHLHHHRLPPTLLQQATSLTPTQPLTALVVDLHIHNVLGDKNI